MKFPTKEVAKITENDVPSGAGDTYVRWEGGTISQLKKLVKIGACDLESA